ncbi:MAG: hypothetical protein MJ213_01230 [Bacilli bacterium]|nr:hypothetical protein [Bacilli bacterium]
MKKHILFAPIIALAAVASLVGCNKGDAIVKDPLEKEIESCLVTPKVLVSISTHEAQKVVEYARSNLITKAVKIVDKSYGYQQPTISESLIGIRRQAAISKYESLLIKSASTDTTQLYTGSLSYLARKQVTKTQSTTTLYKNLMGESVTEVEQIQQDNVTSATLKNKEETALFFKPHRSVYEGMDVGEKMAYGLFVNTTQTSSDNASAQPYKTSQFVTPLSTDINGYYAENFNPDWYVYDADEQEKVAKAYNSFKEYLFGGAGSFNFNNLLGDISDLHFFKTQEGNDVYYINYENYPSSYLDNPLNPDSPLPLSRYGEIVYHFTNDPTDGWRLVSYAGDYSGYVMQDLYGYSLVENLRVRPSLFASTIEYGEMTESDRYNVLGYNSSYDAPRVNLLSYNADDDYTYFRLPLTNTTASYRLYNPDFVGYKFTSDFMRVLSSDEDLLNMIGSKYYQLPLLYGQASIPLFATDYGDTLCYSLEAYPNSFDYYWRYKHGPMSREIAGAKIYNKDVIDDESLVPYTEMPLSPEDFPMVFSDEAPSAGVFSMEVNCDAQGHLLSWHNQLIAGFNDGK